MKFIIVIPILWLFIVFPIWMLVRCILNQDFSGFQKLVSALCLLIIYPIAAWIYAIIFEERLFFKISGIAGFVAMAAAFIFKETYGF